MRRRLRDAGPSILAQPADPKNSPGVAEKRYLIPEFPGNFFVNKEILEFFCSFHACWLEPVAIPPGPDKKWRRQSIKVKHCRAVVQSICQAPAPQFSHYQKAKRRKRSYAGNVKRHSRRWERFIARGYFGLPVGKGKEPRQLALIPGQNVSWQRNRGASGAAAASRSNAPLPRAIS